MAIVSFPSCSKSDGVYRQRKEKNIIVREKAEISAWQTSLSRERQIRYEVAAASG